jgi:hypothetical protein
MVVNSGERQQKQDMATRPRFPKPFAALDGKVYSLPSLSAFLSIWGSRRVTRASSYSIYGSDKVAIQIYMFFLNWRFMKRLQRYTNLKGPYGEFPVV